MDFNRKWDVVGGGLSSPVMLAVCCKRKKKDLPQLRAAGLCIVGNR